MIVWLSLFGLSLAVCAYIYFGYPALLFLLSRLRHRPVRRQEIYPPVTLLIPVHNEDQVMAAKLRNSLGLEYPQDRLEILVVSDGSTDATEEIVRRYEGEEVRLLSLPRCGKAQALNEGVRRARGEIVVFTDANSVLEPASLRRLVENFADPEVGGVCGNKKYLPPTGGDATEAGENLYWRYDKWQKSLESRIGSIFAADGTLYAIRRELYVPMKDLAQADDIAISARVVLQGYRLVYEPRAVVLEEAPVEGTEEFRRKIRVTNHSVRALLNLGRALWSAGFYSLELLSHKLVRHFIPFFLLLLFVANIPLVRFHPVCQFSLALQGLFYALAGAGFLLRTRPLGRLRILAVPYYFCLVNAAALLGVLSILRGDRLRVWTPRSGLHPKEGEER